MRDKKVKENLIKRDKEQRLAKAKQLGKNAPLAKYYREQINKQTLEINAVGLSQGMFTGNAADQMSQTAVGTG